MWKLVEHSTKSSEAPQEAQAAMGQLQPCPSADAAIESVKLILASWFWPSPTLGKAGSADRRLGRL